MKIKTLIFKKIFAKEIQYHDEILNNLQKLLEKEKTKNKNLNLRLTQYINGGK